MGFKLPQPWVVYMTPKEIQPYRESPGARCGTCQLFVEDTSECSILNPTHVDGKNGVCALYVGGHPMGQDLTKVVSAKSAGYISKGAPTRCGTCKFFLPATGECKIVEGRIEADGCCNAWTPKGE